jgi:hypothetical protein
VPETGNLGGKVGVIPLERGEPGSAALPPRCLVLGVAQWHIPRISALT